MTRAASLALALALAGCATVPTGPGLDREPPPAERGGPSAGAGAAPASASGAPRATTAGEPRAAATAPEAEDSPARRERAGADPTALGQRLAARAAAVVGQRGPFLVAGERFNDDCSGFVAAVFAAEGIELRDEIQRAAPREGGSARAAWLAARERAETFGAEAEPEPGDLVFWDDTYDRNRNGKADDPLTHVGIIERIDGETVTFVHRGSRGVARGVMTLARRHASVDEDGRRLNSIVRIGARPSKRGCLAAELFAGFARLDLEPSRAAAELHARAARPAKRRGRTVAGVRP